MRHLSSILWTQAGSACLALCLCNAAPAEDLPAKSKSGPVTTQVAGGAVTTATKDKNSKATVKESATVARKKETVAASAQTGVDKGAVLPAAVKANSRAALPKAQSAAAEPNKNKARSGVKPAAVEPGKKESAVRHKKSQGASASGHLVPPPPPLVPNTGSFGLPGSMIFVGENNIDYMSAADLHELLERTDKELERARKNVDEQVGSAAEKQQRAGTFDQLYAEGVISRRELETVKHEGEKSGEELADAKQLLAALEKKHIKIEQRLAQINKQTKKAGANSPGKTGHK